MAVIPFILVFASILLFSVWFLFCKPWVKTFLRVSLAFTGIVSSSFALLLCWQYGGFSAAASGQKLATVTSRALGRQHFEVSIIAPDQQLSVYEIYGDAWQLDARLVYWDGWLSWVAPTPGFRFERIAGRYNDLQQEIHSRRSVAKFEYSALGLNSWYWLDQLGEIPGLRITHGSSVYVPMADEASYGVFLNDAAMQVRAENDAAKAILKEWK